MITIAMGRRVFIYRLIGMALSGFGTGFAAAGGQPKWIITLALSGALSSFVTADGIERRGSKSP